MPWIIKKVMCGDIEMLPPLVNTLLWRTVSPEYCLHPSKRARQIAGLYDALQKRENYFQENSPTAFGNPEFSFLDGVVNGYLRALEFEETVENGRIIIGKYGGRATLIVDKIKKPKGYYQDFKDVGALRRYFGI